MKSKYIAPLMLALMMAPVTLLAAAHNSQNVTLPNAVTVGSTELPAGTYNVKWDGTGNVTATINKDKRVVASVPATVTDSKSIYNGAIETQGKALQSIQWKNEAIRFNGAATSSTAR